MSLKLKNRKVWFYQELMHGGKTKIKGRVADRPFPIPVQLPSGCMTTVEEGDLYFVGKEPTKKKE